MRAGLDTSVVLRLIVGEPADHATAAWEYVSEQAGSRTGPVSVSDIVVAEAYFALRHHYAVPHAAALDHLHALLTDDRVRSSGVATEVVSKARSERPAVGLVDRLIHADYRQHDTGLVTFDRAASSLAGATLLDA